MDNLNTHAAADINSTPQNQPYILVIDDEKALCRSFGRILRRGGFTHVDQISNPFDLSDYLGGIAPDLITVDINMPWLDGNDVISLVRNNPGWEKTKIIVITARGTEALTKLSQERIDSFLTKPCNDEDFLEEIRLLTGFSGG